MQIDYEKRPDALGRSLQTAGRASVTIEPGDTLSGIISKRYGVGISNAPAAYRAFEAHILAANGLDSPQSLRADDEILLPQLPRVALQSFNPNKALNGFPKFALDSEIARTGNQAGAPVAPLQIEEQSRPGSQTALVYREEDRRVAEQAIAAGPGTTVESAQIDIFFDQASVGQGGEILSGPDADILRGALAAAPKQRPVLIVLDDSWPDDDAFRRARDFFRRTLGQVRTMFKFKDKDFNPDLQSATMVSWRSPPPAGVRHSQLIAAALAPFRALEPDGGRVELIYLPMFTREEGAAEIIEALVTANQVIDARNGQFDDWIPAEPVNKARAVAASVSERLRKLSTFDARSTDVAVVQAVLAFCDYYSQATSNSCFVSMSWTTPNFWFPVRVPESNYGTFVAAEGNEGGGAATLYTLKRQLAMRSAVPPGDILAVMNVDTAGNAACKSTAFGTAMSNLFAVSYSGAIDDSTCGTSFAAPRVAWLLAAREAMRPKPTDTLAWRNALWAEITTSVDPASANYNRYRLRIPQTFQPAVTCNKGNVICEM